MIGAKALFMWAHAARRLAGLSVWPAAFLRLSGVPKITSPYSPRFYDCRVTSFEVIKRIFKIGSQEKLS